MIEDAVLLIGREDQTRDPDELLFDLTRRQKAAPKILGEVQNDLSSPFAVD
jgi:hypothetical protein